MCCAARRPQGNEKVRTDINNRTVSRRSSYGRDSDKASGYDGALEPYVGNLGDRPEALGGEYLDSEKERRERSQ